MHLLQRAQKALVLSDKFFFIVVLQVHTPFHCTKAHFRVKQFGTDTAKRFCSH